MKTRNRTKKYKTKNGNKARYSADKGDLIYSGKVKVMPLPTTLYIFFFALSIMIFVPVMNYTIELSATAGTFSPIISLLAVFFEFMALLYFYFLFISGKISSKWARISIYSKCFELTNSFGNPKRFSYKRLLWTDEDKHYGTGYVRFEDATMRIDLVILNHFCILERIALVSKKNSKKSNSATAIDEKNYEKIKTFLKTKSHFVHSEHV